MKKIENVFYTSSNSSAQTLDIYLPDADSFPVFIYFHGGGFVGGDKTDPGAIGFYEQMANKGVAVITANYRMYPEASYPDFIKDAAHAVAWAKKNMNTYGNPTAFFIGGSSAGGYTAQMLCFDKKYLAMHGIDADTIDGYIMDAGQPTTHFNVLRERGIDGRRVIIDEAAPLYHITGDRNYPPMQILVSENDMENRPEQTQLLVSTLKHFEVDMSKVDYRYMKGYSHCGYVREYDENGNSTFLGITYDFIKKYI